MSESLTLYDAHGSPCARRVRAVLSEKGRGRPGSST